MSRRLGKGGRRWLLAVGAGLTLAAAPAEGQVQLRLADPRRADYSELHERLQPGSPEWQAVRRIQGTGDPRGLWRTARRGIAGEIPWNHGLVALTRLAELGVPAWADTARAFRERLAEGEVVVAPGEDPRSLVEPLLAIEGEAERRRRGDAATLADLLRRVPAGDYGLADAWLVSRLGAGAADSIAARFLAADSAQRVRWLTLASFSTDTTLVPLLARVYAAPDSFRLPLRAAVRASDGLLWIGTRSSLVALRDARERARARGIYADPRLGRNDLDFLAADSASAVARTGRWLDEWLARLP